ncbi:MAG: hypothetical protein Tsb0034_31230 [Ekhidna sp.]
MRRSLLLIVLSTAFVWAFGQETEFSDEDIGKYAAVMVWAEAEKKNMTEVYNGWINNDEVLEASRFIKIRNAKGDSVKLGELEVTAEELTAFETIQVAYDSMIASFTEVYKGKIKDEIGAGLYNSLKKEMKSNAEVKERYQAVLEQKRNELATKQEDESEE